MKRYISAILINALLIHLVGCYSQKAITYEEFRNLKELQDAVVYFDSSIVKLKSDSLKNNYMKWITDEDTLKVFKTYVKTIRKNTTKTISDTVLIAKVEVDNIYIDEYDQTKTIVTILGTILFVGIIIAIAAKNLNIPMDSNGNSMF